ncbi:Arm DNA-binding domain-containing protein [Paenibacillus agricola]|uniref:AP2-like integrase N-terminal domain-containing protein n=1 Tax=Paenibacillus agricola TaxID=2716264 RepID=A0ABX0JHB9_9BACL|nr:Arm DNA-binding domain-containing protein [Paenibacillus agricola]NHN34795.1 hypothetical protein [Paenibacillus agricola]
MQLHGAITEPSYVRIIKKDDKSWYFTLTHGIKTDGKPQQYKKRGFKTKQEKRSGLR